MNGVFWKRHANIKKAIAIVVAAFFAANYVLADAWAAVDPVKPPYVLNEGAPGQFAKLDIETFTIPPHLGEIKYSSRSDSGSMIIHIQDAHCNPFAQKKISEIISYLNKEYGVRVMNLEGGAGEYDLRVFTAISGEAIREEVAEYFVDKGEINGAELYAINNPDKVTLWGIEDKDLYLANLKVYRDSLSYRPEVEKYLREIGDALESLKRQIYTPELMKLDSAYNAYKSGKMDFRAYLELMVLKAGETGVSLEDFRDVKLLAMSMEQEGKVDFKKANAERDALVEELRSGLSMNEMRELIAKTVDFKAAKISRKDFYGYLFKKARALGVNMDHYAALSAYFEYINLYESVNRSGVMKEMDDLDSAIRERLFKNDAQRELSELSRNLALLNNIFNITLTKTDYKYYQDNRALFRAENFVRFIKNEAPKYKIPVSLNGGISKLDGYLDEISRFYSYSFERDKVFLKNMRFGENPDGSKAAVLMTGGFHTENLCDLFEKEKISYVSVIPRFTFSDDYKSPYFEILAGESFGVEGMLKSVIAQAAMLQVASRLTSLGDAVWGQAGQYAFRAAVYIQSILAQNKKVALVNEDGTAILAPDGAPMVFGEKGKTEKITLAKVLGEAGYEGEVRPVAEAAGEKAAPEAKPKEGGGAAALGSTSLSLLAGFITAFKAISQMAVIRWFLPVILVVASLFVGVFGEAVKIKALPERPRIALEAPAETPAVEYMNVDMGEGRYARVLIPDDVDGRKIDDYEILTSPFGTHVLFALEKTPKDLEVLEAAKKEALTKMDAKIAELRESQADMKMLEALEAARRDLAARDVGGVRVFTTVDLAGQKLNAHITGDVMSLPVDQLGGPILPYSMAHEELHGNVRQAYGTEGDMQREENTVIRIGIATFGPMINVSIGKGPEGFGLKVESIDPSLKMDSPEVKEAIRNALLEAWRLQEEAESKGAATNQSYKDFLKNMLEDAGVKFEFVPAGTFFEGEEGAILLGDRAPVIVASALPVERGEVGGGVLSGAVALSLLANVFGGNMAGLKNLPARLALFLGLATPIHEAGHLLAAGTFGFKGLFTGSVLAGREPSAMTYLAGPLASLAAAAASAAFLVYGNQLMSGVMFWSLLYVAVANLAAALAEVIGIPFGKGDIAKAIKAAEEQRKTAAAARVAKKVLDEKAPAAEKEDYFARDVTWGGMDVLAKKLKLVAADEAERTARSLVNAYIGEIVLDVSELEGEEPYETFEITSVLYKGGEGNKDVIYVNALADGREINFTIDLLSDLVRTNAPRERALRKMLKGDFRARASLEVEISRDFDISYGAARTQGVYFIDDEKAAENPGLAELLDKASIAGFGISERVDGISLGFLRDRAIKAREKAAKDSRYLKDALGIAAARDESYLGAVRAAMDFWLSTYNPETGTGCVISELDGSKFVRRVRPSDTQGAVALADLSDIRRVDLEVLKKRIRTWVRKDIGMRAGSARELYFMSAMTDALYAFLKRNEDTSKMGIEKRLQLIGLADYEFTDLRLLRDEVQTFLTFNDFDRSDEAKHMIDLANNKIAPPGEPGGRKDFVEVVRSQGNFMVPQAIKGHDGVTYTLAEQTALGSGTFGVVFKAAAPDGKPVVIKILSPEASDFAKITFLKEYLFLRRLEGVDGVIEAYGAGQYELNGQKFYYMVQEYAEGGSLFDMIDEKLASGEKFGIDKVLSYARQIFSALAEMQKRNILHLDIKPANILVTKDGKLKIADFGLAMFAPGNVGKFPEDKVFGTPAFIPNKAWVSGEPDAKSDVYAAGMILYEMLYGKEAYATPDAISGGMVLEYLASRYAAIERIKSHAQTRIQLFVAQLLDENFVVEKERSSRRLISYDKPAGERRQTINTAEQALRFLDSFEEMPPLMDITRMPVGAPMLAPVGVSAGSARDSTVQLSYAAGSWSSNIVWVRNAWLTETAISFGAGMIALLAGFDALAPLAAVLAFWVPHLFFDNKGAARSLPVIGLAAITYGAMVLALADPLGLVAIPALMLTHWVINRRAMGRAPPDGTRLTGPPDRIAFYQESQAMPEVRDRLKKTLNMYEPALGQGFSGAIGALIDSMDISVSEPTGQDYEALARTPDKKDFVYGAVFRGADARIKVVLSRSFLDGLDGFAENWWLSERQKNEYLLAFLLELVARDARKINLSREDFAAMQDAVRAYFNDQTIKLSNDPALIGRLFAGTEKFVYFYSTDNYEGRLMLSLQRNINFLKQKFKWHRNVEVKYGSGVDVLLEHLSRMDHIRAARKERALNTEDYNILFRLIDSDNPELLGQAMDALSAIKSADYDKDRLERRAEWEGRMYSLWLTAKRVILFTTGVVFFVQMASIVLIPLIPVFAVWGTSSPFLVFGPSVGFMLMLISTVMNVEAAMPFYKFFKRDALISGLASKDFQKIVDRRERDEVSRLHRELGIEGYDKPYDRILKVDPATLDAESQMTIQKANDIAVQDLLERMRVTETGLVSDMNETAQGIWRNIMKRRETEDGLTEEDAMMMLQLLRKYVTEVHLRKAALADLRAELEKDAGRKGDRAAKALAKWENYYDRGAFPSLDRSSQDELKRAFSDKDLRAAAKILGLALDEASAERISAINGKNPLTLLRTAQARIEIVMDRVRRGVPFTGKSKKEMQVRVKVWQRDPWVDLSSSREFYACCFLGGISDIDIFNFIRNKSVQMMDFYHPAAEVSEEDMKERIGGKGKDDREGGRKVRVMMAASYRVIDGERKPVLLVFDVEGRKSGIFGNEDADNEFIKRQVEEYARANGFAAVAYNGNVFNAKPKSFIAYLNKQSTENREKSGLEAVRGLKINLTTGRAELNLETFGYPETQVMRIIKTTFGLISWSSIGGSMFGFLVDVSSRAPPSMPAEAAAARETPAAWQLDLKELRARMGKAGFSGLQFIAKDIGELVSGRIRDGENAEPITRDDIKARLLPGWNESKFGKLDESALSRLRVDEFVSFLAEYVNEKNPAVPLPSRAPAPVTPKAVKIVESPAAARSPYAIIVSEEQQKMLVEQSMGMFRYLLDKKPGIVQEVMDNLGSGIKVEDIKEVSIAYHASGIRKDVMRLTVNPAEGKGKTFLVALKLPTTGIGALFEEGEQAAQEELEPTGLVARIGKVFHMQEAAPGEYEYSDTAFAERDITVEAAEFIDGYTISEISYLIKHVLGDKGLRIMLADKIEKNERALSGEDKDRIRDILEAQKLETDRREWALRIISDLMGTDAGISVLSEGIAIPVGRDITPTLSESITKMLLDVASRLNDGPAVDGRFPLDLHSNNIMMERGTGRLVLVDVGKVVPEDGGLGLFVKEIVTDYGMRPEYAKRIIADVVGAFPPDERAKAVEVVRAATRYNAELYPEIAAAPEALPVQEAPRAQGAYYGDDFLSFEDISDNIKARNPAYATIYRALTAEEKAEVDKRISPEDMKFIRNYSFVMDNMPDAVARFPEDRLGVLFNRAESGRLMDLQGEVFRIGAAAGIQAQGVNELKGGLGNIINIILTGRTYSDWSGMLFEGPPDFTAGAHGPYYIIVDADRPDWQEVENHVMYLVPDVPDREVLNFLIEKSVKEGLLTADAAASVINKIKTYEEFVVANGGTVPAAPEVAPAPAAAPAPAVPAVTMTPKEIVTAQVEAAKGTIGDLRRNVVDWVITPMNDLSVSQKASVDTATTRKLRKDYGADTFIRSYLYDSGYSDEVLAGNFREALERAMTEMLDPKYGDKKPRAIMYVPTDKYSLVMGVLAAIVKGPEIEKKLKDQAPEALQALAERITVIKEDNMPADGVVDEVMHVVLGKGLLNAERFRKGEFGADVRMDNEAKVRLLKLLNTLAAGGLPDDPALIDRILDGLAAVQIRPVDFTEITDWKAAQDEVLRSL